MSLIKPPVLPTWADSGDQVQPSNAEIQTGWPLSNTPPARQRWNWLLNYLMNGVRYFARRGMPDYGADETYMIGDRVIGDDGKTYRSIQDTNLNHTPSSSPLWWERWGFSKAELTAELNNHDYKDSCRIATTANLAALSGLAAIDGVTPVAGDRILVKDQTTGSQNGIYVAASGAWARATDCDENSEVTSGVLVPVTEGTVSADTIYMLTTDGTITIGVTALTFATVNGNVGTPGTYTQVTVDAKGRVVAGSSAGSAAIQGAFKNLALSASGVAATVTVTCDELILGDGSGGYAVERAINGTITTTNTGAGGLDTGALAVSTWYSIWRIGKTDGTRAWLFSLSATAPTMPSGYTLKARIGWFRTDSTGNKYPLSFKQYGRRIQYVAAAGSNVATLPTIISGVQGSVSTPTWVAGAVGAFVPTTAGSIKMLWSGDSNTAGCIVAPNNAYGASGAGGSGKRAWFDVNGAQDTYGGIYSQVLDMVLESSNVYYAAAGSTSRLQCIGWEDNI